LTLSGIWFPALKRWAIFKKTLGIPPGKPPDKPGRQVAESGFWRPNRLDFCRFDEVLGVFGVWEASQTICGFSQTICGFSQTIWEDSQTIRASSWKVWGDAQAAREVAREGSSATPATPAPPATAPGHRVLNFGRENFMARH